VIFRSLSSRARRSAALAVAAVVLPVALLASPVAAVNHIKLFVGLGNCSFSGENAIARTTVKVEWRDSENRLKSKQSVKSNAAGAFGTLCEDDELVEAGDIIKTTGTNGSKTVTVADLSLHVDRASDVAGGTAPWNDELVIEVDTYNGKFGAPTVHTLNVQADGNGDWSADFGADSVDIKGFDDVWVVYLNPGTVDTYYRHVTAQAARVFVGSPWVSFVGNPGDNATLALKDGASPLGTLGSYLDYWGTSVGEFLDTGQRAVRPHIGNHVVSATYPDIDFTIPAVSATFSAASDKVTAHCGQAGRGVSVLAHTRNFSKVIQRHGVTAAGDAFVANFANAPKFDLVSGSKVEVYCKLAKGDVVAREYTLP
jgi:hypothetical protein